MRTESFKGQWCPYRTALVCQEGFCQDCGIYYQHKNPLWLEKVDKYIEADFEVK